MQPDITSANAPACTLCGEPAVVHWQRRLTPDEIAAEQTKEQTRRAWLTDLADPQQPPPQFGPLPDCADWTTVVYACHPHAIHGGDNAAARIHQGACTAPDAGDLPGCNCEPEPLPEPEPEPVAAVLPPGW